MSSKRVGQRDISRQEEERISAVYAFFDVNEEEPGAANELIKRMAADRFAVAFNRVPRGTPRTKKPKWTTWDARQHILEFFRDNQAPGMSLEDVAALYKERFCPERGSLKGLVTEFHRAEKWEREDGQPTEQELDEMIEDWTEMRDEIRRGK